MNQKKASRELKKLIFIALIFIVTGIILKRVKPELYLNESKFTPEEREEALRSYFDELEVGDNELTAAKQTDRGIVTWPMASLIPDFHKPDLSIYKGRSKGKDALSGITIFLDAGKVEEVERPTEAITEETTEDNGIRPAATDPVTGKLLPRYSPETEPVVVETTIEKKPPIPYEEILETLVQRVKLELERMGAEVILTRSESKSGSDFSQAAVVGEVLSKRFLEELDKQKFVCTTLEKLLPTIQLGKDEPAAESVMALTHGLGVSPDLRLLLDVERQYSDVLFLSLRFYQGGEKESGSRVLYFGEASGASKGPLKLSEDRPQDQPAYASYTGAARRRLAEEVYNNIKGLPVDLSYSGNKKAVAEEDVDTGRLSNVTAIEIHIGNEENESNLKALAEENVVKGLADAIATSCYKFYCQ